MTIYIQYMNKESNYQENKMNRIGTLRVVWIEFIVVETEN